jgi:hypothetical protein
LLPDVKIERVADLQSPQLPCLSAISHIATAFDGVDHCLRNEPCRPAGGHSPDYGVAYEEPSFYTTPHNLDPIRLGCRVSPSDPYSVSVSTIAWCYGFVVLDFAVSGARHACSFRSHQSRFKIGNQL